MSIEEHQIQFGESIIQYSLSYSPRNWLKDLTLAGGNIVGNGGAVLASGTNTALTLADVTIGGSVSNENSVMGSGGGIYVAGDLFLSQSVISYNKSGSTSSSFGSGIHVAGTSNNTVIVSQTEIAYNTLVELGSSNGGALSIDAANATISDSWIHHNSSSASLNYVLGIGVRYVGAGLFSVYGSRFEHNNNAVSSKIRGGGLYVSISNQAIIYGSVFTHNVLSSENEALGGGIYIRGTAYNVGPVIVDSTTIDSNQSIGFSGMGGGIAVSSIKDFSLVSSQISNNYVTLSVFTGGSLHGGGGVGITNVQTALIENTTISGNHAKIPRRPQADYLCSDSVQH